MYHSQPLFLYFRLFNKQLTENFGSIKVAGFEPRTSGVEATALPTEPRPPPA